MQVDTWPGASRASTTCRSRNQSASTIGPRGVDRTIIRIGVFELRHVDEVPDAVALSEAVSLARELSTDESPSFVNGLLSKIVELKPTLAV